MKVGADDQDIAKKVTDAFDAEAKRQAKRGFYGPAGRWIVRCMILSFPVGVAARICWELGRWGWGGL